MRSLGLDLCGTFYVSSRVRLVVFFQYVLRGAACFLVRVSRNEVIVAVYCSFDAPHSCHSPLRRVKSIKLILEARSFKKTRSSPVCSVARTQGVL